MNLLERAILGPQPRIAGPLAEIRTADALVDALYSAGVRVVFGLPGGTIAPILDACMDRPRIEVVTSRHEGGAMFAAAGYARASGAIGVVCVTSGPGVLNAITGLANAYCEGIPLLLLAGEVPRNLHGKKALQEGTAHHLNVLAMTRLVSKLSLELTHADGAVATLERAMRTAVSGRPGPVVLTVPMDVSLATTHVPRIASQVRVGYAMETTAMSEALDYAADALSTARRPLLFCGSGVRGGRGPDAMLRLAERLQAPVMTTPKAKGVFPEDHPLSIGVFGHGGHPSTIDYLEQGVDVLLAAGTSLSDPATDGWSALLTPSRELIQIDVEAMQLGRNYAVTQGLIGEAEILLAALADRVPAASSERVASNDHGVTYHSDPAEDREGPEGLITPQRALWELQQCVPTDTYYTCDIGEHLLFATHYLKVSPPASFLMMNGLASMGSGLGAAVGVQMAFPERSVVAVCGDGTFAMLGTEVGTAAGLGLPLLVVVLNDQRYGMVELGNQAIYGRTPSYSTRPMNVADFARSQGADSLVIQHAGDILEADLRAKRTRPLVLDVRIDGSVTMPKNKRFEELARSHQPENDPPARSLRRRR